MLSIKGSVRRELGPTFIYCYPRHSGLSPTALVLQGYGRTPLSQPFHPQVSKVASSSFKFGTIANGGASQKPKIQNQMANSVAPGEMTHCEQSQLDLHCLQRYLIWSAGLKGLTILQNVTFFFFLHFILL